jgi:uncharacterized membrane protein YhaH (DUF805 family)
LDQLEEPKTMDHREEAHRKALRANFQRIERREWWLWAAAAVITLVLAMGLASFLLPNPGVHPEFDSLSVLPQAIRGLVGLIFLFDLYTIYQHVLIHVRQQRQPWPQG